MADTSPANAVMADWVVVSYDGSAATGESLRARSYIRYLQRSKAGPVEHGERWEEFINCGCGTTEDVTLIVESIEGGTAIGDDTDIEFTQRNTH